MSTEEKPVDESYPDESHLEQKQPEKQQEAPPELYWSDTDPLPPPSKKRQFWTGVAWGCIPLALFLVSAIIMRVIPGQGGASYGVLGIMMGAITYIAGLIIGIVNLFRQERRFTGFGMMAAILATPLIALVGSSLILSIGGTPPAQ